MAKAIEKSVVDVTALAAQIFVTMWHPKSQYEYESIAETAFKAAEAFALVASKRADIRLAETA